MGTEEEDIPEKKRKSLLEKYEIPISHLDFSYVNKCTDILELERIIRILRSNEEGSYPDLLISFEERLRHLNPDSKLLRVTVPVMTKSELNPEELKSVEADILSWKEEVECVDNKLSRSKNVPLPSSMYPEVRRPVEKMNCSPEIRKDDTNAKPKHTCSTDYSKWDKFDADSECLKLDQEEEMFKEEKQRKELEKQRKMEAELQSSPEEKAKKAIAETALNLTPEEMERFATKEKDLGNEYYQTNRLDEALYHYTRSICLHPMPVSYNNRAATYLKQCRFSKALEDLNVVLEKEPGNVKAHYRRALAYQHKNEFYKALDDILEVLKQEPTHVLGRHVADQLRENCASLPKKHRVKVRDDNNPSQLIVKELTEDELKRDYKDKDYLEVNDVGLPKIMCNCNGKYTNDPIMNSNDPLRYQHVRERYGDKFTEKAVETVGMTSKRIKPTSCRVPEDPMMNRVTKRNKPLIEPGNGASQSNGVLVGGGKKIEIVEMEKIEEEDQSTVTIPEASNSKEISESPPSRMFSSLPPCRVSDMRGNKAKKTYFGNYIEEEEEPLTISSSGYTNIFGTELQPNNINRKPKTDKMNLNMNLKDLDITGACDFYGGGDAMLNCVTENNSHELRTGANHWISSELNYGKLRKLKNSPQSPLSNSSHNEFSSEIDSDDEFPDDENSSDCIVNIHQAEKVIDNDVDTISKDLFPFDNLVKCECGEGYTLKPNQFETKWNALEKSPNPLDERGKLIRLVCPHQLSSVIGNKLNEALLSGFYSCLRFHFDPKTEKDKIRCYMEAISGVQRFQIITSFLSEDDGANVSNLRELVNPVNNNIEEAFT